MSQNLKLEIDDSIKMEVEVKNDDENAHLVKSNDHTEQNCQNANVDVKCEKNESATYETFHS